MLIFGSVLYENVLFSVELLWFPICPVFGYQQQMLERCC